MVVVLFTWLDALLQLFNYMTSNISLTCLIFFALQDFSKDHMDRVGYGIYTIMDINLLPPLHLIYAENPSDSGKVRYRPV